MLPRLSSHALLLVALVCAVSPSSAFAQRGVPQNGFPSWQERMVQVLTNRARAQPTAEMKACSASTVRPPLVWSYNLNRAARFHSRNLQAAVAQGGNAYFAHDSSCNLVSNLSSIYPPNGTCDGNIACACENGMLLGAGMGTPTFTRIGMFGTPGTGENIAYGYGTPEQVHSGWMNSEGHCSNMLGGHGSIGVGYHATNSFWTQNFGSGAPTGTLISGGHSPQFTGGAPVEFRVNYYHSMGAPQGAQINIDGTCATMTLERGANNPGNSSWLHTQNLSGTACRRYFFIFADPSGNTVYLPETGSYGVGGPSAACADWEPGTPQGCGPLDKFPTVANAATAVPATVGGTTTQLSVLGADDGGEASLVYGWTATGPASVSFSPNNANAAKNATATFGRAGTYVLTASIRDTFNQAVTSDVTVVVTQTPTTVNVTPATAAVAVSSTRQFAAAALDQFGQAVTPTPSFTWSVTGGGTISNSGLFSAGGAAGGPFTVTASAGSVSGTAEVLVGSGNPPLITQGPTANPDPVTGTTTQLSVLATDDGGDGAILYSWTVVGPGAVSFSPNGNNAARDTTATFIRAGTYEITATAQDGHGLSSQSAVEVTVVQTPGELRVTPLQATVKPNATAQFVARARDQFAQPIQPPPTYTWMVSGGGTIDMDGLFTAGALSGGPHTVSATAQPLGGTAQVVITSQEPLPLVVALSQPAPNARLLGEVKLAAQVNDAPRVALVRFTVDDVDVGEAQLAPYEFTWDTRHHPDGPRRLRAGVVDASGETVWSQEVPVELVNNAPDTTPPTVTLLTPASGALSGTVRVTADASDDRGVISVAFGVDGTVFETVTQPPYEATFDASAYDGGDHLLTATAVDAAGNEGRANLLFSTAGGGCGCGAGSAGAGWLAPLWLLVGAGVMRRRRRSERR